MLTFNYFLFVEIIGRICHKWALLWQWAEVVLLWVVLLCCMFINRSFDQFTVINIKRRNIKSLLNYLIFNILGLSPTDLSKDNSGGISGNRNNYFNSRFPLSLRITLVILWRWVYSAVLTYEFMKRLQSVASVKLNDIQLLKNHRTSVYYRYI